MRRSTIRSRIQVLPLLAALAVVGACDDPTEVEEHLEAEGVAIVQDGQTIYSYLLAEGTPTTLELEVGAHDVAFVLLDEAGNPLEEEGHDDHEDEEHVLEVVSGDETILTWTPEAHTDEHAHIEFHGELRASRPGTTTLEVCVPHAGHCDFDADIPVTVTGTV